MSAVNAPIPIGVIDNVVVLRWPAEREEVDRLTQRGIPRLLLVAPGAPPPPSVSCLEDWVRLPAADGDVQARLEALLYRASRHPSVPELDGYGQLSFRGQRVFLSPTDERAIPPLVASFERAVSEHELERAVWFDDGNPSKLRVHVSRLRKRIAPLELEITAVRNYGYRMHGRNLPADSQVPVRDPLPNRHT